MSADTAVQGSATIVIDRPAAHVFAVISDITRMGEWSPECLAGRWVAPATGPEVGAVFEGDNVAAAGPVTLKKWTTSSRVTECEPGAVFAFVAEGYTTWRYDLTEVGGATTVTESFSFPPYEGWQRFVYSTLMRRDRGMVKGMDKTLARVKASLES
ncbi:MAG: SRPBCC family protein [Ilumatobacteraceae bacterium]